MLLTDAFKPESMMQGDEIMNYGRKEGVLISDFDNFMLNGNPIVNFESDNFDNN